MRKAITILLIFLSLGILVTYVFPFLGAAMGKFWDWAFEDKEVSVPDSESKVYLYGPKWERFIELPAGEKEIEVPHKLGIDFGEVEDPEATLFFQKDGKWEKYISTGKIQSVGKMDFFYIKVDKPTRIWVHFFCLKKNKEYVRQKYLTKQY